MSGLLLVLLLRMSTLYKELVIFATLILPRQINHRLLIFNGLIVLLFDQLIILHQIILCLSLPALQARSPLLRPSLLVTYVDVFDRGAVTRRVFGSLSTLGRCVQILSEERQFLRKKGRFYEGFIVL